MKTITLIAASLLSLHVLAGNPGRAPHKYCTRFKDGKLVVMDGEKPITSVIILANGVEIMIDGTIVRKGGSKTTIQEGECADENGNIIKEQEKR